MLCFMREMSLAIFHLCDLGIRIVRMLPLPVGTLLRSLSIQFPQVFSGRRLSTADFATASLENACSLLRGEQ